MPPPESSPLELSPLSSPVLLEPPSSPPLLVLLLGHELLWDAKHTFDMQQQDAAVLLQAFPQSLSVLQGVIGGGVLLLELLLAVTVGAGAIFCDASGLRLLVAFSNGLEFGVDDPQAAMSARALTYMVI